MLPRQVVRLHKVVAGVEIAVVLQRQGIAAGGGEDTERVHAHPRSQGHIEHLHIDAPHVVAHPFVVDANQEAAILFRLDGTLGHQVAMLGVERAVAPGVPGLAPVAQGAVGRGQPLSAGR